MVSEAQSLISAKLLRSPFDCLHFADLSDDKIIYSCSSFGLFKRCQIKRI